MTELARLRVQDLSGVFAARRLGRELADGLGLERQDGIRVATALSEVCRAAITAGQGAVITFGADAADLILTIAGDGPPPADGMAAAARLMDSVTSAGQVIRMAKRRPFSAQPNLSDVREQLAAMLPEPALDELRRNNGDLIASLEDLTRQKEQLQLLNAELQETNQGVMALYSELSEELEQTNRGVVALYRELDEKSEQLRVASASKDRFWANISHELRSPLSSILGLARLLAGPEGGLGSEQLYQVDLIRKASATLLTLVNELLDVAKAESGQLVLEPAEVPLPALLATLRGLARPMTEGKPVNVLVSVDGAPATLLTDEGALTAILRNLMSNAIKYTDEGEVRLTVTSGPDAIEIRVTDTGTGIPEGQLERVFEEFYQVPGARRGGTGLGLPYARRLARLLGGELTLASAVPRGTTAVLNLPHGVPSLATVVVADDDPAFRLVLTAMLDGIAGRVIEAGDGVEALAAIAAEGADLVLADLAMPRLDGLELLGQLPPGLPAIVITGQDIPPPERAFALLAKDQLTRPRLAFAIRRAVRAAR
ncbi:MAG TPA: hybrid sensor histidine kinase/response regulator [Trebonia sp.]|jgi:signal transduction histidine kinase|nr:hybrid sensor histidine kinase/response regulator [Trebonia sp.]